MIRITEIIDKILDVNPDADVDLVERAYVFSARVHDGQMRLSGEPYLSHPLEVAGMLADMRLDVESVAAGLLHDVIEDTHATEKEITDMFGAGVCHIVNGVTKLSKLPFDNSQARQAESLRKMILAMADDIRVILIKLADRIHNMRTLKYHRNEDKKVSISQETLDIYAPIAARLGIYWMKNELEDMAFMYIHAEEYSRIKSMVHKDKEEREEYVRNVKRLIREKLAESNLKCQVLGRSKQFFSIYNKMISQNLNFGDVYDLTAFRIVLDTVPQCYEALGLLHSLWKPVGKKFKDYVGMPKSNMYQSLHTTVIGPYGERIEIQIRTHEMDRVAKSGIAAHWSYKEGGGFDQRTHETFSWIQNLVENQENFADPDEFMENVRIDLFPDEVYVFSPKGDIKVLPKGATPVDFAYLIHTEVGQECSGAKVNGRLVPLQYELKTGEVVSVMTTKGHTPSKDWMGFVKTVKARSKIRQWIKTQEKERSVALGREMCEKTFRKFKLNFNTLAKGDEMQTAVEAFGLKAAEDLMASIGYGKVTPRQLINRLVPKIEVEEKSEEDSIIDKIIGRTRKRKIGEAISVKGLNDILVRFGKCCQPVPGDSITGYITQGQGVTVHRANCVNALAMNPERRIDVEWNVDLTERYPVKIRVRSNDRMGLLADITAVLSKTGANILSTTTEVTESGVANAFFTITVESTEKLKKVISALKRVKSVYGVKRMDG